MKYISYLLYITIILAIYSCESSNSPNTNPLNYNQEQPYFSIDPYIPYNKLDNRIDLGFIYDYDKDIDSNYIRATFYDNREFRNVGDLFLDKIQIYLVDAEDVFNIVQLIDGFIEFGKVYFKTDLIVEEGREYNLNNTNISEFPSFNKKIKILDEKLRITNIEDLKTISKSIGTDINTNLENYQKTRIRIYNDEKNYIFYSNSTNSLTLSPLSISTIIPDDYKIEVLKGYYDIDTLENNETLITNHYSSFIFSSKITE